MIGGLRRTTDVTCLQLWGTTSDTREGQLRQWQLWRWSTRMRWSWIYRTQLDYPWWLISVMLCQHDWLYFGTQSTEEWLDCPRDTWSLHADDATTGCALPPLAWNRAWMTLGAYSEDNEELRSWIQVCQYKETGSPLYRTGTHKFGWRSRRLLRCRSSAVGWRLKDSKLYE
jgi:hypothetical protein